MTDYTIVPERLIYFLRPVEIGCLREIQKAHNLWSRCDYTDLQFAGLIGSCPRLVSEALAGLEAKGIIERVHFWFHGKERRRIRFRDESEVEKNLLGGKAVDEIIAEKIKANMIGKIEFSRFQKEPKHFRNQPWVALPNAISTPNQLCLFGVLYGQHNRGKGLIRLSNTQLAALTGIKLSSVKAALLGLVQSGWISIKASNLRDRRIVLNARPNAFRDEDGLGSDFAV